MKKELHQMMILIKKKTMPNETMITNKKSYNKREGNLCSLYGLHFSAHTIGTHEIKKINMTDTSNECYVIKENDNIENRNKLCRFLLHW